MNRIPAVTRQLMDVFEKHHGSVVALEKVPEAKVSRYGIMDGHEIEPGIYRVDDFIEKPTIEEAPSCLAFAGRYVFQPDVFDYLAQAQPGKNDEIQLTDAMRAMVESRPMFGCEFSGKRHDIGNKLDFLKTNIHYGLRNPLLAKELYAYIKSVVADRQPDFE